MAKQHSSRKDTQALTSQTDHFTQLDQPDYWDICDPSDQVFWDEFFQIEELLAVHDELDPTTFSVTVQNHQTGEVHSYSHIRLRSNRQKIRC